MNNPTKAVLKKVAGRAAGQAARRYVGDGATLDPRLGWALLKDRQVPAATKLLAIGMGVALTAVLNAAQIPMEALLAFLLPFFGFGFDLLLNGAELLIEPFLFAALLLPHLASAPMVQQVRARRADTAGQVPPRYPRR
jgi:hypothetical protein